MFLRFWLELSESGNRSIASRQIFPIGKVKKHGKESREVNNCKPDVMLHLGLVLNVLSGVLRLRMMLGEILVQMSVTSARTSFAIAVGNGNAANDIFALSPRRAVLRIGVSVAVSLLVTDRMSSL